MYNGTQNGTDLAALEAEERKVYAAAIVLISVLSLVGIVGNGHILYIYAQMRPSNPRIFILTLAALDMMTCVTVMPFVIVNSLMPFTFNNSSMCKIFSAVGYFTSASSALVLMMIAIDRYQKICRPFGRKISKAAAKGMCLAAIGITLLLVWPSPILYGINKLCVEHEMGSECTFLTEYQPTYALAFNGVLLCTALIVFITLVVLYSIIRRTIVKHEKYRKLFMVSLREAPTATVSEKEPKIQQTMRASKSSIRSNTHDDLQSSNITNDLTKSTSKNMEGRLEERSMSVFSITKPSVSSWVEFQRTASFDSICSIMDRRLSGSCRSLPNLPTNRITNEENPTTTNHQRRLDSHSRSSEAVSSSRLSKSDESDEKNTSVGRSMENVHKFVKNHKSSLVNKLNMRNKRTTLMFGWITLIFFITFVTHQSLRVAAVVNSDLLEEMSFGGKVTYQFFLWFLFINNVSNWIIYGYWDNHFRMRAKRMYRKLFPCLKK